MHLRLSEIMKSHELFGSLSFVFFADLLQLPPVKGNQPFIPVMFLKAKQRLGAVASLYIWQTFKYDELTIDMRQCSDKEYADLLSRVKVGTISDQKYSLLTTRLISPGRRVTVDEIIHSYLQLVNEIQSPLILMTTTALCNEINTAMLNYVLVHSWHRCGSIRLVRHVYIDQRQFICVVAHSHRAYTFIVTLLQQSELWHVNWCAIVWHIRRMGDH